MTDEELEIGRAIGFIKVSDQLGNILWLRTSSISSVTITPSGGFIINGPQASTLKCGEDPIALLRAVLQ